MRIAFVASNPSHAGPDSPAKKNFYRWLGRIKPPGPVFFFNVSNEVTPENRPLKKSEYELERLSDDLRGMHRVVALGATAEDALDRLGIKHFKLPHPSPRNRVLNDPDLVERLLAECKAYLENAC